MDRTWPLVGRDEEFAFIVERLEDHATGGVVVAGEAGCGKTRLVLAVRDRARESGLASALIIADPSTAEIPLGAFAHLLSPEDLASGDRLRVLGRARRSLEEAGRQLLLVVDDAQHLDPMSASLVHQAAANFAFVLATLRTPEPVPNRVLALWKDGLADRIQLQPLSWPDVQELLGRVLDGPVDGPTLHRLWGASRGNVMYLRELVLGGLEAGTLRRSDGSWAWDGPMVAPRLVDLVASRLQGLPVEQREALGYVAVGEPLIAGLLAGVVGDETLSALERERLVTAQEDPSGLTVRLAHPLYGEVLRQLIGLDALAIKRHLREAFLASSAPLGPPDLIKLALWSLELGEPPDPELLLKAAVEASDPVVGEHLAREAAKAGGGDRAGRVRAAYLHLLGRSREADEILQHLDPSPEGLSEVAFLADVHAANLFFGLGREEEAMLVLDEAEAGELSPAAADQIRLRRADILLFSGHTEEAVSLATDVLDRLSEPDPVLVPFAATTAGVGLAVRGHAAEAIAVTEQGLRAADPVDEARSGAYVAWLMSAQFLAYLLNGELGRAEEIARAGYELLEVHPRQELHGVAALGIARVDLARGSVESAIGRLEEACVLLRRHDPGGFLALALGSYAQAKALLEAPNDAEDALRDIGSLKKAIRLFDCEVELGRAWTAAAAGADGEAQALAVGAADVAAEMGQHAYEVAALHDAIRIGAGAAVAERLIDRAAGVQGDLAEARAEHATAVLTHDPESAERASHATEAMGARLIAAECAAHAAHLYLEAGDVRRARARTARARVLASSCQGARTPLLRLTHETHELTAREQEVARLAADGHSNAEIAGELVVSLRTVENHLHRVYLKLGVSGRASLPDLMEADHTRTEGV